MKTFLFVVCAIFMFGCRAVTNVYAEGPISTHSEQFCGFNAVVVSSGLQVKVNHSDKSAVSISVQESVLPYVDAYVVDSILYVKFRDNTNITGSCDLSIVATTQAVGMLDCEAGASITANGCFENRLNVSAFDGGKIFLQGGVVDSIYIKGDNGSIFIGQDLDVTNFANVELYEGSKGNFTLNGIVDVTLAQGSVLRYYGDAVLRESNVTEGSKVVKL